MAVEEEEVYAFVPAKWKYDTNRSTKAQLYHGQRYYYELGWCYLNNPSTGKIRWFSTTTTGRHKTFDVKEGQKYKILACEDFPTTVVFINDHAIHTAQTVDAHIISIPAGTERVITVPGGWQYMMIHAWRQTNNEMRLPDRMSRIIGYG